MQKFSANQKLIYNPELRFRKEEHRCIAYIIDDFFYSPDKVSVLLPQEVIMLLLFDGEHTFSEVVKNMVYVFDIQNATEAEAETMLCNSLEMLEKRTNIQPLIQDISTIKPEVLEATKNRYPEPGYFVIPQNKIIFNPRDLRLSAPLKSYFS